MQPYRVAGTINYPGLAKIKRGRGIVPTKLIEFDPEVLWTPEAIEAAFPLIERQTNGGEQASTAGAMDEAGIPDETMGVIRDGVGADTDRSRVFFNVMIALKRAGWSVDGIVALLEKYPNGIAQKYRGRLRQEVERVYGKLKDATPAAAAQRTTGPTIGMEALKVMTFAPLKYVVPGVLVEGLTLLAGKPKIGKSWLLLQTGAPDTILVLKRDSTGHFVLHGRGRDLVEIEKSMTFDADKCIWRIAGDAAAVRRSHERNAILDAIAEAKEPVGPKDIAAATGMPAGNVRFLLLKLVEEGAVMKAGYGRYRLASVSADGSVSAQSANR